MMQAFKRRIYGSERDDGRSGWPVPQSAKMRQAMGSGLVSPQFRERLLMAVTAR
ncbi:MAG: hypothetical protein R3D55_25660 [Chloroflexota bacterium]